MQTDRYALLGSVWTLLLTEAQLLSTVDDVAVAEALSAWRMACPEALVLLLEAAASQPELAARLTPALLRASDVLATEACIAAQVVELLERALPSLSPALARVAVAQQAGIRSGVMAPGTRLERMPPAAAQPWPHDQNFPPLDVIEGRQARLRYLGHPSTDSPGDWGVDSQAALVRY